MEISAERIRRLPPLQQARLLEYLEAFGNELDRAELLAYFNARCRACQQRHESVQAEKFRRYAEKIENVKWRLDRLDFRQFATIELPEPEDPRRSKAKVQMRCGGVPFTLVCRRCGMDNPVEFLHQDQEREKVSHDVNSGSVLLERECGFCGESNCFDLFEILKVQKLGDLTEIKPPDGKPKVVGQGAASLGSISPAGD